MGCFFVGKQKVILFPKYRENGWEAAASALKDKNKLTTFMNDLIFFIYIFFYNYLRKNLDGSHLSEHISNCSGI
jgi:hypothetical protein